MKKAILSFDYELFFGVECGTVDECLVSQTRKILDALRAVGGCAVFFVDYLMLKRMREECEETFTEAKKIEEQLKEIVRSGSRIELHLHPHWVDAKYKGNGKWDFSDYRHYCLQSLPKDKVVEMFKKGAEYLNCIAQQVDQNYHVCAFRAGGWAVMPFGHLEDGFIAAGIRVDSSVCSRMTLNGVNYQMNFSDSPECNSYRFSHDVLVPDVKGQFIEVPISSFEHNPFSYVLNRLDHKFNRRKYLHYAVGTYMSNGRKTIYKPLPWRQRLHKRSIFGIDVLNKIVLLLRLIWTKRSFVVFIGHPKDLNDVALDNIAFLGKYMQFTTYDALIDNKELKGVCSVRGED